ncbi:hybrid sensor histidine kinase/response regulator transcription factor [Pararhodonellum marinum]|uniref:hybrid sensor histidine kinase/response regulator transcription factor n=1 Tax=Pararhodonellum marinum TaxID=2755358 RepID=UPI00188F6F5E|nr:two-component regulator propeller domain-containing protein [Pararhodonellum marinum]
MVNKSSLVNFPLFLFLIFLGNPTIVFPQAELSFRQLSVNEGLSQNSAVSVSQDRDGYLWIATQEGLNRYDGREILFYDKKFADITQESHLQLGKVYADSQNRIWIIPDSSVPELFHPEERVFYPVEGIKAASCIFEDIQGNIWIGTFSGQLFKWNEAIRSIEMSWTDPSKEIMDIGLYDEDHLLLTFKDGIAIWQVHTQLITFLELPQINNIHFSCSQRDSNGNIWVGTLNAGLWILEKGNHIPVPIPKVFKEKENRTEIKMVLDIVEDSKGNIWVATYGNGLEKYNLNEKSFDNFTYSKQNPRSLHYNDVLCVYEDYTGTLWFGTDGGGLSFHDKFLEKFNFFLNQQVPENINIDVVRAIFVDENENIWIGTSGKGLTFYDSKTQTWKTYTETKDNQNHIASNRVMSLWGDGNGKIWIGYQEEGLSILDLNTGIFNHYNGQSPVKLQANTIWKIYEDESGNRWLATRNDGLIQFDPQKGIIRHFLHDPNDPTSIPGNNIRTLEKGSNGELWIGTENQGIARLDIESGSFQSFKHEEGNKKTISSNNIKSLYFDGKSTLWIGTNGHGVNVLDVNTVESFRISTQEGLANDVIYGILPDDSGNLWLSSNKGITKITLQAMKSPSYAITNYTNYDGLATEFNTGAYFKDHDGSLYFGSIEGFYWFNPDDILLNETPPKTVVTGLFVFDKSVEISEEIFFKHHENTLTINIASLVFSSPSKNEFLYKLENHDANWIHSGNNNQARYTNLSPGTYKFLAKSSNYDGIWSDEPVSLSFTILPPWYLSWWAKLGYATCITLALIWIYKYLKWRWQVNFMLKMKEDETKRLVEIDKFKTNLFTNISHEFRTPLTLISGPIERLISQSDNPIFKSQLNLIKQNSQRLLHLVDQLLEVSKIKSGKHELKIQKGNLGLLLQSIVANFFYFAAEKNMRLNTDIPLMTEVWFDADKIEKIVSNLIQNALKHGKIGSEVLLTGQIMDNQFYLTVKNQTVKKYDKEEINQLFDKFYKPYSKAEGFGIGLPLVKDLVEINQGEINLILEDQAFFEVQVRIPVDKFAFRPEQILEEELDLLPVEDGMPAEIKEDAPLVLVIEDNDKVRSFILNELQPYYKILEASDGKEGLFIAMKKIPDLILSDVMMPEMDGIELCQKLKNDEKTSHIPIILLSAKSDEENILKGLEVGADDYMLKPFGIKQLLVRIQKLIELRKNLRIRYSAKARITPNEIAITSTDEKFLNKIQSIVDDDLGDTTFTVDQFCKKLGMSRMQLHRKLTALTGLSTSAFIRDQRLRLAIQRLEKSGESISEIAYAVGFSSPSYFIKCFKETYHMTPSEYLEKEK